LTGEYWHPIIPEYVEKRFSLDKTYSKYLCDFGGIVTCLDTVGIDPYKADCIMRFARKGGARKGRPSRGHKGNCACGRPHCSLCHDTDKEHDEMVERKAARFDAALK